jgi:predicted PurR-regulated permease PerM
MMIKYKNELIMAVLLIGFSIVFYYLYGILLPFILGLFLAFSAQPIILRIKKVVRNKKVANTLFLTLIAGIILSFFTILTKYINRDFKRLGESFTVLASNNKDHLDEVGQEVKECLSGLYDFEEIENKLKFQSDSIKNELKSMDASTLDTKAIIDSFRGMVSAFPIKEEILPEHTSEFSITLMLFSTLFYFVLILYQFDYFSEIRKNYFSNKVHSTATLLIDDFNQSFVRYFRLRTKIVLLLSLIYLITFLILDLPGIILITLVVIVLSYIPYLQYFALIPISIGCIVLSVENNHSFLLYFGIIVGVFILASILEELILNPRIMEKNIGMNPVIMVLSLSVWSFIMGLPGLLIGIPMTAVIIIYLRRYFVAPYRELFQDESKTNTNVKLEG